MGCHIRKVGYHTRSMFCDAYLLSSIRANANGTICLEADFEKITLVIL